MVDISPQLAAVELLPDATRRLVRTTDRLADADYAGASVCTGWTRAHVIAHLALNAEALAGALGGILEGDRVPMYESDERRDEDIARLATAGPTILRARLLGAGTDLTQAWSALPPDEYVTTIDRTPGRRTFTAAAVPLMRLHEVEIHHADLDAGYTCADWPPAFSALLIEGRTDRHVETPFHAYATDLDRTWHFGDGGPTVSGTAAALGWWLTGRGDGIGLLSDSGSLPTIQA